MSGCRARSRGRRAFINSKLGNGLAVLATVGSTAPFVGLFGTVIGIYRALIKIGAAGQASIDAVAGPVGEALIMTALGLGRGGAGGARLQLADPPQQGRCRAARRVLDRSARLHGVERRGPPAAGRRREDRADPAAQDRLGRDQRRSRNLHPAGGGFCTCRPSPHRPGSPAAA